MPPTRDKLHVDSLLSQISLEYQNQEYIWDRIFPQVPVAKDSDLFRVYVRNWRIPETLRSSRGVANDHQFDVTTATYALAEHALVDYVSDRDAQNYDLADLRSDTTQTLTDTIQRRCEFDTAQLVMTSTSWSLNVSLAAAFTSNTTTTNPIPVLDTGGTTVLANSGLLPNIAVFPRVTFIAIKNHTSVLDRTKYTSANMTKEMLQGLFDLEEILVGTANYDSSAEGVTDAITPIWTDKIWMGYRPARPGPRQASAGYTFMSRVPAVRRWRDEPRRSEAIEVQKIFQSRVVASLAGYLIIDTE